MTAPQSHALIAWAVAGVAVAIAIGVVAWHAGRGFRATADTAPGVEPIATPTTELPARPAEPRTGGSVAEPAQTERTAAEANRVAAAQARAEREAAEAKQRAERAAAEAKARADREAAAARARAEREAAARRAAEEKAHADAERARMIALQGRAAGAPQQTAAAPQTEEERAREAQLAAEARARAEAERARTAAVPTQAAAPAEPARQPSFFRDEGINLKVSSKLQFNRELMKEQITTKVSGGIVTLTGTVSSQEKRDLAGKVAAEVSGVVGVNNNLKVAGQ